MMGFLDILILGIIGFIFIISLFLLIFSLKSTDDEVKQHSFRRTYIPVIALCVMVFVAYLMVLNLGSLVL